MMNDFIWPERPNPTAFPVARPGLPLILGCAFTTAVLALLGLTVPTLIVLAMTLFVVYFFRDPDRIIPSADGMVVSPADGKVIAVETVDESPFYEGRCKKISIFMSVFNVHVNRIPYEGTVKKIAYHPGKFIAANRNKASTDNERNAIFLETEKGSHITVVQIAGLIARRIICTVGSEQSVRRGQRLGMICFGSRVDLFVPPETDVGVGVGEHVKAGASILGVLP
ncbi:MAG: phosphatidylserine decarboxylase family protein [Desulfobacterales bacterium]